MGNERLGEVQALDDLGDGSFALTQEKEDAQPVLVREGSGQECHVRKPGWIQ
jgi:hypothetical protein